MKVVSLQSKLVKTSLISSVVAGCVALLLFAVISAYQTMQVQDEIMDEISDMLLIADLTSPSGQQIDELSDQFDIQYRLSNQQQVLTQSEGFHLDQQYYSLIEAAHGDYGLIWQKGQLWRSYAGEDENSHMQVLILQPLEERFQDLLHNFVGYALVLMLVWLMQWIMLHFLIKRQFNVIHQLSKQISAKNADDLSPVQAGEVELKELQPMLGQLNRLLQRLDHSLQSEQRFTADASHELRSPLSAIQMRLQLLQRKYPERAVDFSQMQQDVSRGIQILENLLLLARLDPEHTDNLPKTYLSMQESVEEAIQALHLFAKEKHIQLHWQAAADLQGQILANPQLIFTCVRNLVDNAIRYTPEYGQVYISLQQQQQYLALIVENEGQGMDTENLARLGERFYRALGSKTQGSGLGLSICSKIVELHQGKIQFEQSQYGGLKVSILLKR
ncbi:MULTISPECIES: HAMP domain-containing sensor histidine kinase [Acinetobacter]|uniref:sensor histidine kinase n=1 Tax=Acinetobacter TaxID=469 RepID=UPI00051B6D4A|nr:MULTISPECIES: HAMP domain-containing sensor histidine kinase [Acinetobacter]MCH7378272.1 HAMP domain-containing histidine kinase [Acinetobacter higginsii]MCJ0827291.1 HAMP domain-containing histidine kinase [Acinetobacter sp. NIPH1876]